MAKGQKRSNREIRKPKQEKAHPKPEDTFGNQIKLAPTANASRGKVRAEPVSICELGTSRP